MRPRPLDARRKILVIPDGGYPRLATVTGRTITGKVKAEDRYGNRYKVEMQ